MTNYTHRIEVRNLLKRFRIRRRQPGILGLIASKFKSGAVSFEALSGIDMSVDDGEVVGVIGRNGSGKSTLLKIIAGLLEETDGSVRMNGEVLYLSGFSHGSNPYLTVRQNIFLVGSIFGLRSREIRKKMRDILQFAGLGEFLDTEAYKLSAGMAMRLDVSVLFHCMEHARPSVLLLDEILSTGGDIEFHEKSMNKIENLIKSGSSVVIASHDLELIRAYCTRALWIEKGKIMSAGPAPEVAHDHEHSGSKRG